ncbi:MAG: adenylate/guanylate cyclase domain-containing protein [Candidatus Eiseniibacteriota bacterium]
MSGAPVMAPPAALPDVNRDYGAVHDALIRWFNEDAYKITSPWRLVREVCSRLVGAGVPLQQFTAFIYVLHPNFFGVAHRWERSTGKVNSIMGRIEVLASDEFSKSPVKVILDGAAAVRRRLDRPGFVPDFPVLLDYIAKGATDYLAMQLEFTDGVRHSVSLTCDRPGGFTLNELRLIDGLMPYMARLTEIQSNRYLARTLLDTYVGPDAGEAILTGNIRRGSAETLHAIVWMCDLRGFTGLSESLPRDELIALLNDYFECVGTPVRERGGEILKFIGDAMLAIFRIGGPAAVGEGCRKAAEAVTEARARLAALNEKRAAEGKPALRCGIALHIGDVSYGNIGTVDRLDFTVIGPAVNLAARLTTLCGELGETVVLSEAVARGSHLHVESLGRHGLKGIAGDHEVFRLLGLPAILGGSEPIEL